MSSFLALVRKDVRGYFDQPAGYIILVIFVGVVSYFYFDTALVSGEASLRAMFGFMPWLLALFVAASTMRLVAEEQRDGTLEIVLTQPVWTWAVLAAKFVAAYIFASVGILATIGIPLAIGSAGDLDGGAVIAQYIGTFFLTAAFVSIGLFTSSLTRNQIVAFILGIFLIMLFMLAGLPIITLALPTSAAVLIQDLSPLTHFDEISRGVLELRDVLYFVSLVATFLLATYLMIRGKSISHRSPLYRNLQLGILGMVVVSVIVGWFGQSITGRLDLTEEKLYTLSDESKELLNSLDDYVTIKLFASKDPPVQVALMTRDVDDFLRDVESASKGKVRVIRRYPDEDPDAVEEAQQSFVQTVQFSDQSGTELRIKLGHLGMGMTYANRQEVISIIRQLEGLEYEVMSDIVKMVRQQPKTLGFLTGHGERFLEVNLQNINYLLGLHYNVVEIQEDRQSFLNLDGVDVLVIPGPRDPMPQYILAQIDDYIASGGKTLWLVDPVRVDPGQLIGQMNFTNTMAYLRRFGVDMAHDVVFDKRSNEPIALTSSFGETLPLRYPYWPRVQAVEQRISGAVRSAVFPWPSSMAITEPTDHTVESKVIPLFETTEFAGIDESFFDLRPGTPILEDIGDDELGKRLVAAALIGTKCPPPIFPTTTCQANLDNPFRMIVASDSEWLIDGMLGQFREQVPLIINWVDWLMQEDALATLRAKGRSIRPLLFTSDTHTNLVQYSNIVGVPAIFVVLGLVRFFMRRHLTRKVYRIEK